MPLLAGLSRYRIAGRSEISPISPDFLSAHVERGPHGSVRGGSQGFEERPASQRLSARCERWRSAHQALVVSGDVETLVGSATARGLDADGVIHQALRALFSAAVGPSSMFGVEIVDRHMDAETNLLPPNGEDRAASNSTPRSTASRSHLTANRGPIGGQARSAPP